MRKFLFYLGSVFFLVSCEKQEKKVTLIFSDIKQFPQEIVISQYSKNFVYQTDTIQIETEKDVQVTLAVDRPKYAYVQKNGEVLQLFLKPGAQLAITKDNNQYQFEGDLKRENSFIQEIENNEELRKKDWNYDLPFDDFKKQVGEYFAYKRELLDENLPERDESYFYRLNKIEDRAFQNHIILAYISTRSPVTERDSLFFQFLDQDLLDFKKMEPYLDASNLRWFYSKKAVEYFMMKKYEENLDSIQKQKEFYVFRNDIISEYFDQPLKSILIYDDLRFYPQEYDMIPDSSKWSSPRDMLNRYKDDLNEEAYTSLSGVLDTYEAKKITYAEGAAVPDFLFRDEANQAYELRPDNIDKLVLLDVWASWCGPCIRSFPKVKDLEQQYPNQLEVISISIDNKFNLFKGSLNTLEVPGKLKLYAEGAFNSDFAKHFQITGIPRYILFDENGKIIDANLNFSDIDTILEFHL